jgi:hypothetical protein
MNPKNVVNMQSSNPSKNKVIQESHKILMKEAMKNLISIVREKSRE